MEPIQGLDGRIKVRYHKFMVNDVNSGRTLSLPSIGLLFKDSWQTFTKSILNLFILNVLGIIIYLVLGALAVLVFMIFGAGSVLLQKGIAGLATMSPSTIIILIGIAAVFGGLFFIVGAVLQVASVLIVNAPGEISVGTSFKRSFRFVIPLLLTGILTFVLTSGAFFVFFIPAILFYFLLIFVQFEVILNNQRWTGAVKRSVLLISSNFGGIFIRLILLVFLYLGYAILVGLIRKIGPETQTLLEIISFLVNIFLGWFVLSYSVTLYKQAAVGLENQEGKSILWMWIVAAIGWFLAIVIGFATWKLVSSRALETFQKKLKTYYSGASIQRSVEDMSPEAKTHYNRSQELFEQIRENQDDAEKVRELNDENIAEIKKALEIEPNNPKIYYELGNAYTWVSSTGSLEDALAAYQKAEELDPNNVIYINGVGNVLMQMGKYEEAILQFQKTFRLTDKSGFANLSIARAYSHLQIYDLAKEHYQKAIEIFTEQNEDGRFDDEILQARKELSSLPR